jgi:hypothetical protein
MVYPKSLIHMHKMVKLTMQRRKFILTFFIFFVKKFYMMMFLMNGQIKLMKTLSILLVHVISLPFKILMKLIKILNCIMLFQIHCFN